MTSVHSGVDRSAPAQPEAPARLRPPRHRTLLVAATLVIAAAASLVVVLFTRDAGNHSGARAVWSDSFSGPAGAAPDAANWLLDTGTAYPGGAPQWGTGEIERYVADRANAELDGHGHLRITATKDAAGRFTSARLETRRSDFQPARGGTLRVEARIETPAGGAGYWPAFWMLGDQFRGVYTNWPRIGEIDIMENKGSEPATVHGTLHCGVDPGGPCDETNGISAPHVSPTALSGGFHTYAVEWDRSAPVESISWSVDGHRYLTVRSDAVDNATWAAATHHGFFVLLDLAIGGSFGGPIDAATKPSASMLVDYVTVSRH